MFFAFFGLPIAIKSIFCVYQHSSLVKWQYFWYYWYIRKFIIWCCCNENEIYIHNDGCNKIFCFIDTLLRWNQLLCTYIVLHLLEATQIPVYKNGIWETRLTLGTSFGHIKKIKTVTRTDWAGWNFHFFVTEPARNY